MRRATGILRRLAVGAWLVALPLGAAAGAEPAAPAVDHGAAGDAPLAAAAPPDQAAPAAPEASQPANPAPPAPGTPPKNLLAIFPAEATSILGKQVQGAAGEDMGRIVDLLVDADGQPRAAVIDFGGFLGVGSRKIVVDWNALHFGRVANKGDSVTLELTKEQVVAAPEYKEDTPIVVLGAAGSLQPWQFDH